MITFKDSLQRIEEELNQGNLLTAAELLKEHALLSVRPLFLLARLYQQAGMSKRRDFAWDALVQLQGVPKTRAAQAMQCLRVRNWVEAERLMMVKNNEKGGPPNHGN